MHSEEFWSYTVRAFNIPLFEFRPLKTGSTAVFSRKTKLVSNQTKTQLHRNNFFPDNAQNVMNEAMSLSPADKAAYQRGMDMFNASVAMDDYSLQSIQLSAVPADLQTRLTELKQIIQRLGTMTPGQAQQIAPRYDQLIGETLEIVINALDFQKNRINALQQLGQDYSDRRAVLCDWNRNTRIFLRRLRISVNDTDMEAEIDRLDRVVEGFRAELWIPAQDSPTCLDSVELYELADIRAAIDDPAHGPQSTLTKCRGLRPAVEADRSLFFLHALRILEVECMCRAQVSYEHHLAIRAQLQFAINDLTQIAADSTWDPGFTSTLNGWVQAGRNVLNVSLVRIAQRQ